MTKWYEVFAVLDKYGLGRYGVYAEHDVISISIPPEQRNTLLKSPEWPELEEFGFSIADEEGYLYIYV